MLLIARLDDGRTLYAVEREDRGLYAICKLGSWINLHQLRAVSANSLPDAPSLSTTRMDLGTVVQTSTVEAAIDATKFSKKKRLAIEAIQSMVKRPTTGLLPEVLICETPVEEKAEGGSIKSITSDMHNAASGKHDEPELASGQLTANEIIENIRSQYFDALYISKVSSSFVFLALG